MATTPTAYLDRFIAKARNVHGDRYNYDRFVWTGAKSKGIIVCSIDGHGEFEKTPEHHAQRGQGCPKCSNAKKAADRSYTKEMFVAKAIAVHGDTNDYDEFVYVDSTTKGWITCRIHDLRFEQTPSHHLFGHTGCPECIQSKNVETQQERYGADHHSQTAAFREKVRATSLERFGVEHHSQIADFRDVMRASTMDRYGVEFASQSPEFQERVRQTSQARYGVDHQLQSPEVRDKITKTNLERYGVENVLQMHISPETIAILKDKAAVSALLEKHSVKDLARHVLGIAECTLGRYCRQLDIDLPSSSYERAIINFLRDQGVSNVYLHDRSVIAPLEVDILMPDLKLGIEFCGIYWHAEECLPDKDYHLIKLRRMNDAGYRLITIFEDEWLHRGEIAQSRLRQIIGINERGKAARHLSIAEIDASTAKAFLTAYHIQGAGPNGYARYGAYEGDRLVATMTFSGPRVALGRTTGADELLRFATDGKSYAGVASRLFKAYLRDHAADEVISYADRRWSNGRLYETLGFTCTHETEANYWYTDRNAVTREHRFKYRKNNIQHLVENGDQKTEREIMRELGRDRIWDCGSLAYRWRSI